MTYNSDKYHISFVQEEFSNGLHILLCQNNKYPIIYTSVLYHVGSKDELPGKTGYAHFFEHLMFEGSKNINKGDYFKLVALNGGENNAYTNHDETYYYDILPSNHLPLALWLESERMLYAKLDKNSLNIQKNIVKEERKMRMENQPYIKATHEIIPSLLFKKHQYRNPIIGIEKDLETSTEEDYIEFYKKYYVPNNSILSISGDFNISETMNLCKKYFGKIPIGDKNSKNLFTKSKFIKELPITREITITSTDENITVPGVFLSYRVSKINDEDSYVLKMLDFIFFSGESSRIIHNVVNVKQVAAYAGSFLELMEDYGKFTFYGIIHHGVKLDDLSEAMDEEIYKIQEKGITSYELKKKINIIERKLISDNYYVSYLATNLSHCYLYYKDVNLVNNEVDKYKNITNEDIKRVAKKYLNINSRVRLYNIPVNNKI